MSAAERSATGAAVVRLGIIGANEGNGHPYSWSAICNGYDAGAMAACPYPAIPAYLGKQRFPNDAIPLAHVTHIWTQDRRTSEAIAAAALIPKVVQDFRDMAGEVDAVLVARDDAETHFELAAPLVEAGIPILLDKMAAPTSRQAAALFDLQRYPGQVQSGSLLRHAPEFQLTDEQRDAIGRVRQVHGMVMNAWETYAIHAIEPALNVIGLQGRIAKVQSFQAGGLTNVSVVWENGVCGTFQALGRAQAPIVLTVVGEAGFLHLQFQDTFRCFRRALSRFIDGVRNRTLTDDREFALAVISLIEAART